MSDIDLVRQQTAYLRAEAQWLRSRGWYRFFRWFNSTAPEPVRDRSWSEVREKPSVAAGCAGADLITAELELLASTEETVSSPAGLRFEFTDRSGSPVQIQGGGLAGVDRDTAPVEPDREGRCRCSIGVPPGAERVKVTASPWQARSLVFVRNLRITTELPELQVLKTAEQDRPNRIALYGDLDVNIVDGSSIWLVSLAQVFALTGIARVELVLKRTPKRNTVVAPLGAYPEIGITCMEGATVSGSVLPAVLRSMHAELPFKWVVVRGFEANAIAASHDWLAGRLVPYITDLPQPDSLSKRERENLLEIISAARLILCQTSEIGEYYKSLDPGAEAKLALLPPMIPPPAATRSRERRRREQPYRIVYAGKFAPDWAVEELLDVFGGLRREGLDVELHVFGDKFQGDGSFRNRLRVRLREEPGIIWYGSVTREEVLRRLTEMDLAWAWRRASLEEGTRELSTKLLEYGSCGVPVLLYPNQINVDFLGADYPLFARSRSAAARQVRQAMLSEDVGNTAVGKLSEASKPHTFEAVARHLADLLSA